jgi:hypothetical protein
MKCRKFLIAVIAGAMLSGCSAPKIDATSDETMKSSIEKVRKSLPESQRKDFDDALGTLAFSQFEMKDLFAEGVAGVGNLEGKVKQSLHGKTGTQVIAEAARIDRERTERERQQALDEIKELVAKQASSEKARVELTKFQVLRSRFHMSDDGFMGKQPIVELTVLNGTTYAISRAYFEGTVASPNRSVPWLKETFNYEISGGIEPGEKANWSLAPNMFSEWGKLEAPADAILTVTVERLDGPDGKALFSANEFEDRDLERLNALKAKYEIK